MNYFDQIMAGAEQNIMMLLGSEGEGLDPIKKKSLFKRNVEIVNLELSYLCNRKCDYCPVMSSSRTEAQRFMPVDLLKKICAELAQIRYENRLSLNLYNEPLLDPFIDEKIAIIKNQLPYSHVAFNSNGDKLNFEKLQKLSNAGCDLICVTLHPAPYKSQTFEVILRRVRKFYEKLAKDQLPDIDLSSRSHFEFRALGVTVKLQWPDWRIDGTTRAGLLIENTPKMEVRVQPCAKPFREFTIFYDGIVQPCCEAFHDDKINLAPMGNLNESTIFDVYSSALLARFRRHVFDFGAKKGICEYCTVADYSDRDSDSIRKGVLSKMGF